MNPKPKSTAARTAAPANRFLASVRAEGGDQPHPAMLALAKQPRGATRKNRRLTEFLRIDRGIEA